MFRLRAVCRVAASHPHYPPCLTALVSLSTSLYNLSTSVYIYLSLPVSLPLSLPLSLISLFISLSISLYLSLYLSLIISTSLSAFIWFFISFTDYHYVLILSLMTFSYFLPFKHFDSLYQQFIDPVIYAFMQALRFWSSSGWSKENKLSNIVIELNQAY